MCVLTLFRSRFDCMQETVILYKFYILLLPWGWASIMCPASLSLPRRFNVGDALVMFGLAFSNSIHVTYDGYLWSHLWRISLLISCWFVLFCFLFFVL